MDKADIDMIRVQTSSHTRAAALVVIRPPAWTKAVRLRPNWAVDVLDRLCINSSTLRLLFTSTWSPFSLKAKAVKQIILHETVLCPLSESQSENFVPQTAAITTKKLRLFQTDIVLSLDEAVNLQLNNMKRDRTCQTRTTLGDNNKVSDVSSLLLEWNNNNLELPQPSRRWSAVRIVCDGWLALIYPIACFVVVPYNKDKALLSLMFIFFSVGFYFYFYFFLLSDLFEFVADRRCGTWPSKIDHSRGGIVQ